MSLCHKLKLWGALAFCFCGLGEDHKILLLEKWSHEVLVGCLSNRAEEGTRFIYNSSYISLLQLKPLYIGTHHETINHPNKVCLSTINQTLTRYYQVKVGEAK